MFIKFLPTIFTWWLYILFLTLIFLPVADKYLKQFPGNGYAFAKTMGISFTALGSFLFAYLHLAPVGKVGIFAVPVIIILLDLWIVFDKKYRKKESFMLSKKTIFEMIGIELLFLSGLMACAYMRSQQPDLLGLEKYMDYGFVKSILRSTYMPAADIWLAGSNINYYYFGQYICAVMSMLTSTAADISYNMMLAVIFAESLILSFSLGAGIYSLFCRGEQGCAEAAAVKVTSSKILPVDLELETQKCNSRNYRNILIAGVITMFLLALGGNFHSFFYGYAFPFAEKAGIHVPITNKYFYPDSTRFIGYDPDTDDKTITEFPSYSAVVADLHGHVSDIPQVLLFVGFAIALCVRNFNGTINGTDSYSLGLPLLAGALIGAMFMTNAWDYPIYFTVAFLLLLFSNIRFFCTNAKKKEKLANALNSGITLAVMVTVSIFVILPFSKSFENFSQGIAFVRSHSPFWQLFMLWGHFWVLTLPFVIYTIYAFCRFFLSRRRKPTSPEKEKMLQYFPSGRLILLILILCGYGLIMIPEIIYVRDIYEQGYHRANTMFKVTYQAFMILSLCCGPAFIDLCVRLKSSFAGKKRLGFLPVFIGAFIFLFAIASPLLFMFKAVPGYYGNLKPSHVVGLQGTDFLNVKYRNDKMLIDWLNENVSGQPVILEAPGDSYSDSSRVSAMTGLPTLIGWHVHEWLWRNSNDVPTEKEKEAGIIFAGTDGAERLDLIKKYNIKYIILSDLEKKKYPGLMDNGILDFGKIVFKAGESEILEVKQ